MLRWTPDSACGSAPTGYDRAHSRQRCRDRSEWSVDFHGAPGAIRTEARVRARHRRGARHRSHRAAHAGLETCELMPRCGMSGLKLNRHAGPSTCSSSIDRTADARLMWNHVHPKANHTYDIASFVAHLPSALAVVPSGDARLEHRPPADTPKFEVASVRQNTSRRWKGDDRHSAWRTFQRRQRCRCGI